MRPHSALSLLLAGMLLLPAPVHAQAITFDPGFGTNGQVPIPVVGFMEQIGPKKILELADGRKLAAGMLFDFENGHQWGITRLMAHGAIDASFGEAGMARVSFSPQDGELVALAERPDGRIVIAGHSSISMGFGNLPEYHGRVAQLLPNGQLDPAFGDEGIALVRYQDWRTEVDNMALQADGKVLVVGRIWYAGTGLQFPFVARLHADGTMDESFGSAGEGIFTLYVGGEFPRAPAVTVQPDGRIVVVVTHTDELGAGDLLNIVRLMPDGETDPDFGDNGHVYLPDHRMSGNAIAPEVLPDGRIRIFYESYLAPYQPGPPVYMHLLADGGIDTSHGASGLLAMDFPSLSAEGYTFPWAMKGLMDSAGRTIVVGRAGHLLTKSVHAFVARFLPDGAPDLTFSANGIMLMPEFREAVDAALQPDGKLVVGMYVRLPDGGDGMTLVRFHPVATGIEAHTPSSTLAAWPVPACDQLNLRLPDGQGAWTMTVHAADGRPVVVPMHPLPDHTMQLTVRGLPAGAYVVHAVRAGRRHQARFVVEAR